MATPQNLLSPVWGICLFGAALLIAGWLSRTKAFYLPRHNSARYGELDGLRGILAFAVFLTHVASTYRFRIDGKWEWPHSSFYTLCGYLPVSIFFMITGFLFWKKAIDRKLDIKALAIGRTFRLLPLYLFAMALLVICVGFSSGWTLKEPPLTLVRHIAQWCSLGVLGRPNINGLSQTWTINPATWTLRPEAIFYISLPIIAIAATPFRFLLLSVIVVVAAIYTGGIGGGSYWIHFLFGMAAAHMKERIPESSFLRSNSASAACLVLLFALWLENYHGYGFSYAATAFPIFIAVVYGNSFFGILKNNAVRYLGEISYSIYLMHGLVLYGVFTVAQHVLHLPVSTLWVFWLVAAASTIILVATSTVTYTLIEKPLMNVRSLSLPPRNREKAKQRSIDANTSFT